MKGIVKVKLSAGWIGYSRRSLLFFLQFMYMIINSRKSSYFPWRAKNTVCAHEISSSPKQTARSPNLLLKTNSFQKNPTLVQVLRNRHENIKFRLIMPGL